MWFYGIIDAIKNPECDIDVLHLKNLWELAEHIFGSYGFELHDARAHYILYATNQYGGIVYQIALVDTSLAGKFS